MKDEILYILQLKLRMGNFSTGYVEFSIFHMNIGVHIFLYEK